MLNAKLLVPAGAPLQFKAGEILPPVQPKPLNTCSLAMVPPSLISALLKVMLCAFAAVIPSALAANAAIQTASLAIASLPMSRNSSEDPTLASHSNFCDGAEGGRDNESVA